MQLWMGRSACIVSMSKVLWWPGLKTKFYFMGVTAGTWNGAIVAVKVLAHTPEDKMEENIEREVQLMTELKHPNIVQQYQSATRVVRSKTPKVSTLMGACHAAHSPALARASSA